MQQVNIFKLYVREVALIRYCFANKVLWWSWNQSDSPYSVPC